MTDTTTNNKEAAGAINTNGLHTDTNKTDCCTDTAINQATANNRNAIATQLECLALAGHVIHKNSAGDLIVCKFGIPCYFKDFARRLGVK